jgi:hypothetical protein
MDMDNDNDKNRVEYSSKFGFDFSESWPTTSIMILNKLDYWSLVHFWDSPIKFIKLKIHH